MSDSYLLRTVNTLEASRADIGGMETVAEEAARRLASGGRLWAAGTRAMTSELTCRAGGFMMIRTLGKNSAAPGDVVLSFPPDSAAQPDDWPGRDALVVTFGQSGGGADGPGFPHRADAGNISPSLAVAIPGWLFTGELIAALTRLGKTPVIYESVGAYEGTKRIHQFKNGEVPFHEDMRLPPSPPGVVANRYVDAVSAILRRVEKEQRENLDRGGAFVREARAANRRLYMYGMGHILPNEIGDTEIGKAFHAATWNAGFRKHPKPNDAYAPGDVAFHIGYQHPPDDLLRRARPAGARVVYAALRSDRDFIRDPDVVWIDPMWDWLDACVPLDGYDVPLLPASGIVNAAIAWEIHRSLGR